MIFIYVLLVILAWLLLGVSVFVSWRYFVDEENITVGLLSEDESFFAYFIWPVFLLFVSRDKIKDWTRENRDIVLLEQKKTDEQKENTDEP
jgi:hypothetical protein